MTSMPVEMAPWYIKAALYFKQTLVQFESDPNKIFVTYYKTCRNIKYIYGQEDAPIWDV